MAEGNAKMTRHPYPEHIIDDIEKELRRVGSVFAKRRYIDQILQAFWDASQVHHPDQLADLPDGAAILENGTVKDIDVFLDELGEFSFPAHIVSWGDESE